MMRVNPYEQGPGVVGRISVYLHILYAKVSAAMPDELDPNDCPCLDCAFEQFAQVLESQTGERPEREGECGIPQPTEETLDEYKARMTEEPTISDEEAERLARMLEGIEGLTDD